MGPGFSKMSGDGIPDLEELQNTAALKRLLTADQEELLDLIDKFREYGLTHTVDLPQLVVCGNQSCGKSSVLEAISGLTFPRGETLCTTFATELVLRRGPTNVSMKIKPPELSEPVIDFQPSGPIEKFGAMINEAKEYLLGQHPELGESSFLEETLHIEAHRPGRPPLSLVDLPGLIQSANRNQTQHDVELVHNMVRDYMANSRTIILAVISAQDDPANQKILKMATDADPAGVRTLGIITKPDKAGQGSKREQEFITYAQNNVGKYHFRLGWHVIRSRDFNEEDLSLAELEDRQFGLESKWRKELEETQLGVEALQTRLSKILYEHIRASLPSLMESIKEKLQFCEARLKAIDKPRSTAMEQQRYLLPICKNFERLVKDAVSGDFNAEEVFKNPKQNQDYEHLRAFVERNSRQFADCMYERGHRWAVRDSYDYPEWSISKGNKQYGTRTLPATEPLYTHEFIGKIIKLLELFPPRLPGTFDPRLVTLLFRNQSKSWEMIAEAYVEKVFTAATQLLVNGARKVAIDYTARALEENLISQFLVKKSDEMKAKLAEILKPFLKFEVAIYTRWFKPEVLKRRTERSSCEKAKELDHNLESWIPTLEPNGEVYRFASLAHEVASKVPTAPPAFASTETEILDLTYSYYKIALGIFIENVIMLVVESCLMCDLHEAVSADAIMNMGESDPHLLAVLASEPEHITKERTDLEKKKKGLNMALATCRMKVGSLPSFSRPKPDIMISPPERNDRSQEESSVEKELIPSQNSTPRSDVRSRSSSTGSDSTSATTPGLQDSNLTDEKALKSKHRTSSSSDGPQLGSSEAKSNVRSGYLEDSRRSPTPKARSTSRSRLARIYGRQARNSQGSIGAFPVDDELADQGTMGRGKEIGIDDAEEL